MAEVTLAALLRTVGEEGMIVNGYKFRPQIEQVVPA